MPQPHVIVIGGPNGAGKTTIAPRLLRDLLAVPLFVNADTIAEGLAGFDPRSTDFQAGRIMLARLEELAWSRSDFAFETTLASRTFAPRLRELRQSGYWTTILFMWLPTADMALRRVAQRVQLGGHFVAEEVVRRRYQRGLENFSHLHRQLADHWGVYDNSQSPGPRLVARGGTSEEERVIDGDTWERIRTAGG